MRLILSCGFVVEYDCPTQVYKVIGTTSAYQMELMKTNLPHAKKRINDCLQRAIFLFEDFLKLANKNQKFREYEIETAEDCPILLQFCCGINWWSQQKMSVKEGSSELYWFTRIGKMYYENAADDVKDCDYILNNLLMITNSDYIKHMREFNKFFDTYGLFHKGTMRIRPFEYNIFDEYPSENSDSSYCTFVWDGIFFTSGQFKNIHQRFINPMRQNFANVRLSYITPPVITDQLYTPNQKIAVMYVDNTPFALSEYMPKPHTSNFVNVKIAELAANNMKFNRNSLCGVFASAADSMLNDNFFMI